MGGSTRSGSRRASSRRGRPAGQDTEALLEATRRPVAAPEALLRQAAEVEARAEAVARARAKTLSAGAAAEAEARAWELLLAIAGQHAEGGPKGRKELDSLAREATELLEAAPPPQSSIDRAANKAAAAKAAAAAAVAGARGQAQRTERPREAARRAPPPPPPKGTAAAAPAPAASGGGSSSSVAGGDRSSGRGKPEAAEAVRSSNSSEQASANCDAANCDGKSLPKASDKAGDKAGDGQVGSDCISVETKAAKVEKAAEAPATPPASSPESGEKPAGPFRRLVGAMSAVGTAIDVLAAAAADEPLPKSFTDALESLEAQSREAQGLPPQEEPREEEEVEEEEEEEEEGGSKCAIA